MTPGESDVAPHMARFLDMLDMAFRRFGVPDGLPPRFRDAVAATPRHCFVHRFRIADGPLCDRDAEPARHLSAIYSDAVMRHVDAAGELLPSSNSQPSYILYLLYLLGLEPGHKVLEIGSGSGWLAAVMARLIGPAGRVNGIELIPALAAQSRADLTASGAANVEIITGDGTQGWAAGSPYDRAIITAATWDVPEPLLDQVAEGGLALVPIEPRGGDGCDVTVLRRQGACFVAEQSVPGWFVPLQGGGQERGHTMLDSLPDGATASRFALPLGLSRKDGPASAAALFRAFLGRTEPGFTALPHAAANTPRLVMTVPPFGLRDVASGSTALWIDGDIVCYGDRASAVRLAGAYRRWAALGLPGTAAFRLEVHRAGAAPQAAENLWIEQRGSTVLAWHLRADLGTWQGLG